MFRVSGRIFIRLWSEENGTSKCYEAKWKEMIPQTLMSDRDTAPTVGTYRLPLRLYAS